MMLTIKQANNQGVAEYKKDNFAAAVEIFKQAFQEHARVPEMLTPAEKEDLAKLYYNLASAESGLGQYEDAHTHFQQATEILSSVGSENLNKKYLLRTHRAFSEYYLSLVVVNAARKYSLLDGYKQSLPRLTEVFENHFQMIKTEIENTPAGEEYVILSIGCGIAEEFYAFWRFLGDELFSKIKFIGVDINQATTDELNAIATDCKLPQLTFHCMDARDINALKKIAPTANYVVLRHPQIYLDEAADEPSPFQAILENTVPALTKTSGTHILVSTFDEVENETANRWLNRYGSGTATVFRPTAVQAGYETSLRVLFSQENYVIIIHKYKAGDCRLSANPVAENKQLSTEPKKSTEPTTKKYMCVNPYEGFVCKRNGNHAGVALPNFRTCYAIIILTSDLLLTLHYPSRCYSQQLPDKLKKWQDLFKQKIVQAWIVQNKHYAEWGASTGNNIDNFQTKLNQGLKDTGLKFTVVEVGVSCLRTDDLLMVNLDATIKLRSNDLRNNSENYLNFPIQPSSRLRYYTSRLQFFIKNDDFPVTIVGSKNFLAPPIDEKEWPIFIKQDIQLLKKQKSTAVKTISQNLVTASIDKSNKKYPWAMAIGLEGSNLPNNLKQYLYLLLSLMQLLDETVSLEPFKEEVDGIDTMFRMN